MAPHSIGQEGRRSATSAGLMATPEGNFLEALPQYHTLGGRADPGGT